MNHQSDLSSRLNDLLDILLIAIVILAVVRLI